MHAAAKHLHSLGQIGRCRQGQQGLFFAQVFDMFEGYGFSLSALLGQLIEALQIALVGVCQTDDQQQIAVQIAVVKGANGGRR